MGPKLPGGHFLPKQGPLLTLTVGISRSTPNSDPEPKAEASQQGDQTHP